MTRTPRTLIITLATVLAFAVTTPSGHADHAPPCPEYTLELGGVVYANDQGQLLVDLGAMYVTVDEVASNDYLFSIWYYAESNGEPGLQRHDDYCTTPGYGDWNDDTTLCWKIGTWETMQTTC